MLVKRFTDAQPYFPPNHFDIRGLRLQGYEAGGPENFSVGLSHFLPGGYAGPDSSPFEKVYVVLAGSLSIWIGDEKTVLGPFDSCTIATNEVRKVANETNDIATILVVMPYPPS
jgi:quercetin dioxygenase-like cupin family protein